MTQLNGKCKEDFEKWFSGNYGKFETTSFQECASAPLYQVYFDEINLPREIENALIIEFFDSVGVYINIIPSIAIGYENADFFYFLINNYNNRLKFNSRQEATIQAIKKANDLYNERFK